MSSEKFVNITADEPVGSGPGGRVRRWFIGPPGGLFLVLVTVNAALTLAAHTAPGSYLRLWLFCVAGWIGLGLAFAARLGLVVAGDGWRSARVHAGNWAAVPAVMVVTAALVSSGVPLRTGLELAKPDVVKFAENPDAATPERVGPFRVERAERLPAGGVRFIAKGAGFLDSAGFAYLPQGTGGGRPQAFRFTHEPFLRRVMPYQHLSGSWYVWTTQS